MSKILSSIIFGPHGRRKPHGRNVAISSILSITKFSNFPNTGHTNLPQKYRNALKLLESLTCNKNDFPEPFLVYKTKKADFLYT